MVSSDVFPQDRKLLGEPKALAAANRAFHTAVYRAAHNRFLVKASDALAEALALLGPTTLSAKGRGKQSVGEHQMIVSAIKARDPEQADAAARSHIRAAFEVRLMQLDESVIEADPLAGSDST